MTREWHYWTRNKLEILAGYLPAFNIASKKARTRVYIDLMAGDPVNRDKVTGIEFDGSARLAMSSSPGFARLAFCEQEPNASALKADLEARFTSRNFEVYPGDCNRTIDAVLADLAPYCKSPTFVFVDQQAAEVHWATLAKVAHFRLGPRKSEIWILVSPAMVAKGVSGTNGESFAHRVDLLYGNSNWRRIQHARERGDISADEYRDEMVNLLRWQLEQTLGYTTTARIPMHMPTGVPIYDMVFATDHYVGEKIMSHLYRKAAEREPQMVAEAKALAAKRREEKSGRLSLFDIDGPVAVKVDQLKWEPAVSWDPTSRSWWSV